MREAGSSPGEDAWGLEASRTGFLAPASRTLFLAAGPSSPLLTMLVSRSLASSKFLYWGECLLLSTP